MDTPVNLVCYENGHWSVSDEAVKYLQRATKPLSVVAIAGTHFALSIFVLVNSKI